MVPLAGAKRSQGLVRPVHMNCVDATLAFWAQLISSPEAGDGGLELPVTRIGGEAKKEDAEG